MRTLRFTNTLTKKKEAFIPLQPGKVGIYACGVTVYDKCHLGHGRSAVAFDVLNRYLRKIGYQVTFVRNITDVDDKIIKKANEQGVSCAEISERYIAEQRKDMQLLNVLTPDEEPKATEHIDEMISMISRLIEKGHAYEDEAGGNVFFDIASFSSYGKLSGKNIEQLEDMGRVEHEPGKRSPLDFTLWKKSKPNEPTWNSPWGEGRPGWHIECSAMSRKILGESFDIHGGGMDLIFPHHENEIAQSEAASGKNFVNYWLHNGFVTLDKEKMSKSLGNFFTLEELFRYYPPEALRFFFLMTHYRSPVDFSIDALDKAYTALGRIYHHLGEAGISYQEYQKEIDALDVEARAPQFFKALDDDLNSAAAIAVLNSILARINKAKKSGDTDSVKENTLLLLALGDLLGILKHDFQWYVQYRRKELLAEQNLEESWVEEMVAKRNDARSAKEWEKADKIRNELSAKRIKIMDMPEGSLWRVDATEIIGLSEKR